MRKAKDKARNKANNIYTHTIHINEKQPATTGGYAKYSAPRIRHSKSILAYRCASLTYTNIYNLPVLLQ